MDKQLFSLNKQVIRLDAWPHLLWVHLQVKSKLSAPVKQVIQDDYVGTGNFSLATLIIDFVQFKVRNSVIFKIKIPCKQLANRACGK